MEKKNMPKKEIFARLMLTGLFVGVGALYYEWKIVGIMGLVTGIVGMIILAVSNKEWWGAEKNPLPPPTQEQHRSAGKQLAGILMAALLIAAMAWNAGEPAWNVGIWLAIGLGGTVSLTWQILRPKKKTNLALVLEQPDEQD
jgi:hypothetical protein